MGVGWEWNDRWEIEHLSSFENFGGNFRGWDLKILKLRLIEKE